jgi:hypothetical protein
MLILHRAVQMIDADAGGLQIGVVALYAVLGEKGLGNLLERGVAWGP